MKTKIKFWYSKHRNIINLSRYILVSLILLLIAWYIDVRNPSVKAILPDLMFLKADTSEAFLTNLSGVFLSISTFTFTTILTVLNIYQSTYSPRIIQNFIEKPIVLNVLGTFIGGFFYTILALFMLRNVTVNQEVISGTLGVGYALLSMVTFILFVREVIEDVKASNILQDIYEQGLTLVKEEVEKREDSVRLNPEKIVDGQNIYAHDTGYLYNIDFETLLKKLGDFHGEFVIASQMGQYVTRGQYIAELKLVEEKKLSKDEANKLKEEIAQCFIFYRQRNDLDDYHNEISNLSEIVVRALSSGVADPNTAISALRKIADLLGRLFVTPNNFLLAGQNENMSIIYTGFSIEEELYPAYGQIINAGMDNINVMIVLLEGLHIIYMMAAETYKDEARSFFEKTYRLTYDRAVLQMDKDRLEKIKENFLNSEEVADEKAMREEDKDAVKEEKE